MPQVLPNTNTTNFRFPPEPDIRHDGANTSDTALRSLARFALGGSFDKRRMKKKWLRQAQPERIWGLGVNGNVAHNPNSVWLNPNAVSAHPERHCGSALTVLRFSPNSVTAQAERD